VIRVADLHRGGLGARIALAGGFAVLAMEGRRFPDGESYLRIDEDVSGQDVWIVADLSPPDAALVPVLLLADALHAQGASRVGLLAPYLPYMRQDMAFRSGEVVSARHLGALLSQHVDALLTVDAHLHRIASLDDVFRIPAVNLSAAGLIGDWVREHVRNPLLVGPDAESAQWVEAAARVAQCPCTVLRKERYGDRYVCIEGDFAPAMKRLQAVLVDDVASTCSTLIEAGRLLQRAGFSAPQAAVVHAIFTGDAADRLGASGVERVVSSDSLPHPSNGIALAPLLSRAVREFEAGRVMR
jgi:ribose-phosphate pyrophosphokinase